MNWLKALFGGQSGPKNLITAPDLIWVTTKGKSKGLATALDQAVVKQPIAVLLVAHFEDTFAMLEVIQKEHKSSVPVMVTNATQLNTEIASQFQADDRQTLAVIVGERHPLLEEDDRIIKQFAVALNCKCDVQFHLSLEDPIMQPMAGEQVRKMITQLGMRDDDCISSGLVTRRIRRYQQELAKQATGNQPARTAEQWLELNT